MADASEPRLILVGGSNLSFGINSQMIEEFLNIKTVNTGIHASIGLKYMMDSVVDDVRDGDVVILAAEYDHFFGDFADGGNELLRVVFDVDRSSIVLLDIHQWLKILPLLPKYAASKLNPDEYTVPKNTSVGVYEKQSFNIYGDVDAHWDMEKEEVIPYGAIKDEINEELLGAVSEFQTKIQKKNATLYISFPGFQDVSFQNSESKISNLEKVLKANKFSLLGTPERYRMNNSMIFNTPYHLTKEGADLRTHLLIEDLLESHEVLKLDTSLPDVAE